MKVYDIRLTRQKLFKFYDIYALSMIEVRRESDPKIVYSKNSPHSSFDLLTL